MLRLRRDCLLFPGGRSKALTLSYDDGVTQDERLINLMNRYGIPGTFNLNPGLMGHRDWLIQPGINVSHFKLSKDKISSVYSGHEIAVHTMTHPDLVSASSGTIAYEVVQCRKELEDITKKPVTGMAYPMGTYSDEVKKIAAACGIRYGRTTKQTFSFAMPEDFLEWHPTCHHTEICLTDLLDDFLGYDDPSNINAPKLFYVWGHSYEFDAFGQWGKMEDFLKTVSGKENVWYACNGEIREYVTAADSLIYSATGDYIYNPSCVDVWMQIDGVVRHIPSGSIIEADFKHSDD